MSRLKGNISFCKVLEEKDNKNLTTFLFTLTLWNITRKVMNRAKAKLCLLLCTATYNFKILKVSIANNKKIKKIKVPGHSFKK